MSAISIKNISKSYDGKTFALDDVTLEVHFGQITALLGANGAGKSTTLNIVSGLLQPNSGEVLIAGNRYDENFRHIKRKMGMLSTEMSLYNKLTIHENLLFFGKLNGIPNDTLHQKTKNLYELLEMNSITQKKFNQLSSGQQQKALIACTMVHDPDILVFDEITANLDVLTSRLIMDFLIEQKKEGKAILFSTHNLSEAEYISDIIAILHDGKISDCCGKDFLVKKHQANNLHDAFYRSVKNLKEVA